MLFAAQELLQRRLGIPEIKTAMVQTAQTAGMIFIILLGAEVFDAFLALSQLPMKGADMVRNSGLPPYAVMALLMLFYILLGAVAVVVFGSLATEALSVFGVVGEGTLFSQQWEYLDLPRIFQILLTLGMFIWIAIIWRGLRSRLKTSSKAGMPWLFFFSGLAIPMFYAVGLIATSDTPFAIADFWRFWVVHLWVEDFLELFTTVMVAYLFVLLGVVRERVAMTVIFLDIILYSIGGVIGTMHHLYFSGTPTIVAISR